jgi:hypothetical protein
VTAEVNGPVSSIVRDPQATTSVPSHAIRGSFILTIDARWWNA